MVTLIEGMTLPRPAHSVAIIHRTILKLADEPELPGTVLLNCVRHRRWLRVMLAHEGTKRYEGIFDLLYRRQASAPNDTWQADHTELDLWVIAPSG